MARADASDHPVAQKDVGGEGPRLAGSLLFMPYFIHVLTRGLQHMPLPHCLGPVSRASWAEPCSRFCLVSTFLRCCLASRCQEGLLGRGACGAAAVIFILPCSTGAPLLQWMTCPRTDFHTGWLSCEPSAVYLPSEYSVSELLTWVPTLAWLLPYRLQRASVVLLPIQARGVAHDALLVLVLVRPLIVVLPLQYTLTPVAGLLSLNFSCTLWRSVSLRLLLRRLEGSSHLDSSALLRYRLECPGLPLWDGYASV